MSEALGIEKKSPLATLPSHQRTEFGVLVEEGDGVGERLPYNREPDQPPKTCDPKTASHSVPQ